MPLPTPLVSTVLSEIGARPSDDELEYVLGKVYAAASPLKRKGLVDKLVSQLQLEHLSGVVTAPHEWRKYAADIINRRLRKMDLPDITAQQLLDLAQEYQRRQGREKVD